MASPGPARQASSLATDLARLLALARLERLSVSLYRFRDRPQVTIEVHPASDFHAQEEDSLEEATRALAQTLATNRRQGPGAVDGASIAAALTALLAAANDLTVFVNFLHPAGSEDSCRVEVVVPDPLHVVANCLAPEPSEALSAALELVRRYQK